MTCPSQKQQLSMPLSTFLDAIVNYYGAVDFSEAIGILRQHFDSEETDAQLLQDIQEVLPNCRYAKRHEFLLCHVQVSNPLALYQAIKQEAKSFDQGYATIQQSALLAFKQGIVPDYSIHHTNLKQWLVHNGICDPISAQIALNHAMLQMNLDWTQERVVQGLTQNAKSMTPETLKALSNQVLLVYQHTPKWRQMGHTPHSQYTPSDAMKRPENLPTS